MRQDQAATRVFSDRNKIIVQDRCRDYGEDRLLRVISWRLAIMLAFFTVIGAGLISLVGGGSP